MRLYSNLNNQLSEVNENTFKLEKDIQVMFEANLNCLMGLLFITSEFEIKNRRIDTLAFDNQTKAFTIIEYKRDKNISVIDQGFTYLSLMLENKAEFIVEYNERFDKKLKREEVDWSQTRVAFISTGFTENQIQATNFKDIAIELWEVKQFLNASILVNQIKKTVSAPSIKTILQKSETFKSVTDEIKIYTEELHCEIATEEIKELYDKFKNAILNLTDNIEIIPRKLYIAFKKTKNITDISVKKYALEIFINIKFGQLDDPKGLARDVSTVGHWGNGDYQLQVKDDQNLEYIMSLIKQAII